MFFREELKNEFEAGTASFLIRLRSDLEWDKEAFSRLISAMQKCCELQDESETVERWLAQGFWYIPAFVRNWTTHPDFPRPHPKSYYEQAYERPDDLAFWFFFGGSPYLPGKGFEPL
jgi:hypothetical protein